PDRLRYVTECNGWGKPDLDVDQGTRREKVGTLLEFVQLRSWTSHTKEKGTAMRALMRNRLAGTRRDCSLRQVAAILLPVVVALVSATAQAQYRCVQPGGTVSYQQTPCAADSQARRLELSPSATSTPGGSENRTDWAAVIRGKPQGGDDAAGAAAKSSNSSNCPTPQQIKSMEYDASKLSNRHNSGMQRDLARARACR
ncbi:MAG TPA: DUF4124 domain-containing protein, partial [Ramlibacter sp.]|nr:DUF4124 domain-containing protein [Ramlibacter sp.]